MTTINTVEKLDEARNGDSDSKGTGNGLIVPCYKSLVEHWAKARIDGPVQAVARYDDSAKQLITIGGFLQAGIIAVYSALSSRPGFFMSQWQIAGVISFELTLLFFIGTAAWVCTLQPELKVEPVSTLLVDLVKSPDKDALVTNAMCQWCEEFTKSVKRKQSGMLAAKISFFACCLTLALLFGGSIIGSAARPDHPSPPDSSAPSSSSLAKPA
jgi:hypothetical protein